MNTDNKNDVYYASDTQPVPGQRQSHLCCGVCCDTRRGTIIVNIANIVMALMGLLGLAALSSGAFVDQLEDDSVKAEMATASQYAWIGMLVAGLSIAMSALGIYGAMNYNGCMVATSGVFFVVQAVMGMISKDVLGSIMAGLFAYPHYIFFQEMKKGIMTPQNYPNEKHSCCCV